jgi:hypothetical protein
MNYRCNHKFHVYKNYNLMFLRLNKNQIKQHITWMKPTSHIDSQEDQCNNRITDLTNLAGATGASWPWPRAPTAVPPGRRRRTPATCHWALRPSVGSARTGEAGEPSTPPPLVLGALAPGSPLHLQMHERGERDECERWRMRIMRGQGREE